MSYVDTIYCGYMLSALFNLSSVAFRLVSAKVPEYNISLEPKPGKVIKLSLCLRVSFSPFVLIDLSPFLISFFSLYVFV